MAKQEKRPAWVPENLYCRSSADTGDSAKGQDSWIISDGDPGTFDEGTTKNVAMYAFVGMVKVVIDKNVSVSTQK